MTVLIIYIVLGSSMRASSILDHLSGLPSAAFRGSPHAEIVRYGSEPLCFVGVIMLIGIVKKNAIMMIDFALEAEKREGRDLRSDLPGVL
jgi:HAE1 family hydrophobic/amphiphilic exporter-1